MTTIGNSQIDPHDPLGGRLLSHKTGVQEHPVGDGQQGAHKPGKPADHGNEEKMNQPRPRMTMIPKVV